MTWGGATSTWATNANWVGAANFPDTITENGIINAGQANMPTAGFTIGCITSTATLDEVNGAIGTYVGDSFTSTILNGIAALTKGTIVMGPHTTANTAQVFTFNQTNTLVNLTVANASIPGAGLFGATITNTNAGTATFTTLANTGLNTSKYIGNITAGTYTNTQANTVDVAGGVLTINGASATNTVSGGSFNIRSGGTLAAATFNPVAGFTTTIDSGGMVSAPTSSIPAASAVIDISGTFTTPTFTPTAGATITVKSGGNLNATTTANPGSAITINLGGTMTAATFSPKLGSIINDNGTLATTTFTPVAGSTVNVNTGGALTVSTTATSSGTLSVGGTMTVTPALSLPNGSSTTVASGGIINANTSTTPGATSTVSITGTLNTPIFSPASGATITVNNTGLLHVATSSAPASNITVATGGTFTDDGSYSPASTSTTNVSGTMNVATFTPQAGATINVLNGGVLNVTNFTPNATTVISVAAGGTLNITTLTGALAATVSIAGTVNITNLPTISSGLLSVSTGGLLNFINGVTLASSGFSIASGGTLQIGNTKTVTLNSGVTLTTPIYAPTGTTVTTLISTTANLNATTSCTPSATSIYSVTGTLTTPAFAPIFGASITVNSGGLINATTSSIPASAITIASGGSFTTPTYSPTSTSTTNINGTMTVTTFTPGASATINTNNGGILNVTTFTPNSTSVNTVATGGALNITTMSAAMAATVNIAGTATVTNLPVLTSGTLNVQNSGRLKFTNGVTMNNAAVLLKIQAGGTLEIANTKTITLTLGTFQVLGTEDGFPQNIATKGTIEALTGETFDFTTTGGTLDITGFNIDRIGVNGLNIGGSTIVTNLKGGQFSHLSTIYASVKAIQINTSGTLPAAATTIAWNWGAFNNFTGTTPISTAGYKLVSSTGCSGHSIDFTGWTGDWYETQTTFDLTTVYTPGGCGITLSGSVSAVDILSFMAIPFNKAIDIRWRTNAERNHLGFNVYKTDMFSVLFQQINKTLIRNLKNPGSNHADYRFIDREVNNGEVYYYYIEDVEVDGKKILHGPISATAMANLGAPPVDNPNENSDTNLNVPTNDEGSPDTSPAPIPNPGYQDLGYGIKILSKTNKTIRIEIAPPLPVFTASGWDNTYQDVSIPGYSKMTLSGNPELPDKDIMIEVQSNFTTAKIIHATVDEKDLAEHLISPAPDYALKNENLLSPSFHPNSTIYEQSYFYPSTYFSLKTDIVSINKTKFLKLKINPLKLNASIKKLTMANKITLDIGLDGDDWDVTTPDIRSNISPYSVNNALRIDYSKSGIYQISYEDFIDSEVEDPFKNSSTQQWRLYYKMSEIPLEIHSANGYFGPGDFVRFYAPFTKEIESKTNQLILSPVPLIATANAPKRMENVDVDPAGQIESSEPQLEFNKIFEQNYKYIDGVSLGDNLDHFFYADLVNYPGMDVLSVVASLPEIDTNSNKKVQVKYHVRGRLNMAGIPVKHHVVFLLGTEVQGESTFIDNNRKVLTFEVPANLFIAGSNTLQLKVDGKFSRNDENDFVLIDKVEIAYRGYKNDLTGINNFSICDSLTVHRISNLSDNQIEGYDITFPLDPKKMTNIEVTTSISGDTFAGRFFIENVGTKYFSLFTSSLFLKPTSLSLNPDNFESLKSSSNRADLIVYGSQKLITALQDLIDKRIAQGFEVKTVTPEQVYSEFSFGIQKSSALKDFMNTALDNWEKAPKFLLILGDGTFDPLDFNVNKIAPSLRSALESFTLPAPLIAGRFIDFSSDNYFVSSYHSHLPRLSVGRLPTNDPDKIKAYVNKVQNYEEGTASPVESYKNITFFADEDTGNYENFNLHSRNMITASKNFITALYDRTILGSKSLTKEKINNEFNLGPLVISMMGHGAFDRFGNDIYNINDAKLLSNKILPIVTVWNCESAYFYDANNSYKSLAEELIFNPKGGAIVVMGSTTQSTPPAQEKLAINFFSELSAISNKPWTGVRLGELLYQAKVKVGDDIYEKDIVNSFSIIGDPSLILPPQLFTPAEQVKNSEMELSELKTEENNEQKTIKKMGAGCSANASDGASDSPWYEGFLEWFCYMSLIVFGVKKTLSKRKFLGP